MSIPSFIERELADLRTAGLERHLSTTEGSGRMVARDGGSLLNFSSNNYLGLASHPGVLEAGRRALSLEGGATGSRLVTGTHPFHVELESKLARFHRCEAALVFPSTYQANLALLSTLAGHDDVLFSARANHASLIDGCRLSRAKTCVYDDLADLESQLSRHQSARRRFVASDSLFSMLGTLAPCAELSALCQRYHAQLILDEAHAVGCVGPSGQGLCAMEGVEPLALTAGLGKSFGVAGGYIAGSRNLIELVINRGRSFVFTTALLPAAAAMANAALTLATGRYGEQMRERLNAHSKLLRDELGIPGHPTPIVPIVFGHPTAAVEADLALRANGFLCQAIRPPTVPIGSSMLRVCLSALHESEDVQKLAIEIRRIQ